MVAADPPISSSWLHPRAAMPRSIQTAPEAGFDWRFSVKKLSGFENGLFDFRNT